MKKVLIFITLVIVFFSVVLISLEVVVRIFYPQPIFSFFPYSSEQWLDGANNTLPKWGIEPSTNLGFKVRQDFFDPRDLPRAKNAFKILVLGDSVTTDALPPPAYPRLLEDLLNSKTNKILFDVWNFAVPTYNTLQEKELLKESGLKLNPNMIILGFCLNDFAPGMLAIKKEEKIIFFQPDDDIWLRVNPFLFTNSSLYRLLISRMMQYKIKGLAQESKRLRNEAAKYPHLSERYFNTVYDSISYIKEVSESKKIDFLILIFPLMKSYNEYSSYEKDAYNAIVEIAGKLKIPYIDFRPYFEKRARYDEFRYLFRESDYMHFNNKGHVLVAEVLYKYLVERKLLN